MCIGIERKSENQNRGCEVSSEAQIDRVGQESKEIYILNHNAFAF